MSEKGNNMAKKSNGKKKAQKPAGAAHARKIAQRAMKNFQLAEEIPIPDSAKAAPDASTAPVENAQKKYGVAPRSPAKAGKELHMVLMESKSATDDRIGRQRRNVIVDDQGEVGVEG